MAGLIWDNALNGVAVVKRSPLTVTAACRRLSNICLTFSFMFQPTSLVRIDSQIRGRVLRSLDGWR